MSRILILGAGAMGSALTVPACDNGHEVTLVGTPLDEEIVASVNATGVHPNLQVALPQTLTTLSITRLTASMVRSQDIVVLGISSPGMDWALSMLTQLNAAILVLALVTKGLVGGTAKLPRTYADTVPESLSALDVGPLVAIGGPCIARELALRQPTAVVYASHDPAASELLRSCLQTDYYRIDISADPVGVEACAALKNFLAIGIASTLSAYRIPASSGVKAANNPTAAAFNQAVREMRVLSQWLGGSAESAVDLAGMGDLHVTVGGGRNSRLGVLLGEGLTVSEAMSGPLAGETVEGKDTGWALSAGLAAACSNGELNAELLPLTHAIVAAITLNEPLNIPFLRFGN